MSKEDHCLADLLHRWRSGDLECDIPGRDRQPRGPALLEWHGIPFHYVPVSTEPSQKAAVFKDIDDFRERAWARDGSCRRHGRHPPSLCARYGGRIINIHHSCLLRRSRPYHQVFARGVKLIGATCHYVTADLDEGPIISRATPAGSSWGQPRGAAKGGAGHSAHGPGRGLRWHLEDRVLLNGSKTIVFRDAPGPSVQSAMTSAAELSSLSSTLKELDDRVSSMAESAQARATRTWPVSCSPSSARSRARCDDWAGSLRRRRAPAHVRAASPHSVGPPGAGPRRHSCVDQPAR